MPFWNFTVVVLMSLYIFVVNLLKVLFLIRLHIRNNAWILVTEEVLLQKGCYSMILHRRLRLPIKLLFQANIRHKAKWLACVFVERSDVVSCCFYSAFIIRLTVIIQSIIVSRKLLLHVHEVFVFYQYPTLRFKLLPFLWELGWDLYIPPSPKLRCPLSTLRAQLPI